MGALLAVLCGAVVGFSLGLVGGGGSILAVPLLLYVVGVRDPHVAIGTSALAVSINAFINLLEHWRAGNVIWPCAVVFAMAGVIGAAIGSTLGKQMDAQQHLFLFALMMIAVGLAMLIPRKGGGSVPKKLDTPTVLWLSALGLCGGFVSGFFGIGGGFLIVPGLMLGSGMPIINAIGSSLFSVSAFGLTTAINYSLSGLVDWWIAAEFIAGGAVGGYLGMMSACRLAQHKRTLTYVFVAVIVLAAIYIMLRTASVASAA